MLKPVATTTCAPSRAASWITRSRTAGSAASYPRYAMPLSALYRSAPW